MLTTSLMDWRPNSDDGLRVAGATGFGGNVPEEQGQ